MNLNDLYLVRDALDTALTGGGNDTDVVDALQLIENDIQAAGLEAVLARPTEATYGDQDNEVSNSGDDSEGPVVEAVDQTVGGTEASQV